MNLSIAKTSKKWYNIDTIIVVSRFKRFQVK